MEQSERTAQHSEPAAHADGPRAFLEGLTGPSRGKIFWLTSDTLTASVGNDNVLRIERPTHRPDALPVSATLIWDQDSYRIDAQSNQSIWVNGHKAGTVHLKHGDMIEFEERGPMTRYRLGDRTFARRWPVEEIVGDALAYARSSRRPLPRRLSMALGEGLRRTALQTTLLFRVSMVLALCLIVGVVALLYRNDRNMQAMLEQDARRIEAVTLMLAQTRDNALSQEDLAALRHQFEQRLDQNMDRLGALERRSEAAARVIAAAAPSVAFVQGAFGLRHIESGELLKQVIGPDGKALTTPFGQPRFDPHGNGPPAEFRFTGTGFLLDDGQRVVTNRHVALPWTSNDRAPAFEASGLRPEMLSQHIYFPGIKAPKETFLLASSDAADLAVLSIAPDRVDGRGLSLARTRPRAGDAIFLLGYPTGLRALLAQAGKDFIGAIQGQEDADFWSVAAELSQRDLIQPLASQGIVAQINAGTVIYDAETTVGGSGGPALNRNGRVVAVNAAILPEFGGSNIGVPVTHLEALLRQIAPD
jgi:S1-C subfamily serine protease